MDAIYVRQSVDKVDSISIESQIADCEKLVAQGTKYEVYQDKGYSGKNTDRPAFQQMMENIEAGLIERVVVWKLDRLSRSLLDFSDFVNRLKKHNVRFISVKESSLQISGNPADELMLNILSAFAQFERETIQMRVVENYYARGKQGFYLGGRAPYGFQKVQTQLHGKKTFMLVPIAEEVAVMQKMYDLYGNGGCSLGQVQKWLHEQGLKTKKGNYFQKHAIARILGNPVYVKADADVYTFLQSKGVHINNPVEDYVGVNGVYLYGKTKGVAKDKYNTDSEEYATLGIHEGVVPADLWLRVQDRLAHNHNFGSKGTGTKSWLTGLVRCGYCGTAVFFKDGGREGSKVYTICRGRIEKYCYDRKKALTSDVLEEIVEGHLLNYLKTLKVKTAKRKSTYAPQIQKLKIEATAKDNEITTYLKRVPEASPTVMSYINQEVERLNKEKLEILEKINELVVKESAPEFGGYSIDDVVAEWSSFDMEQRKSVAKVFIQQVTVTDDDIKVVFY